MISFFKTVFAFLVTYKKYASALLIIAECALCVWLGSSYQKAKCEAQIADFKAQMASAVSDQRKDCKQLSTHLWTTHVCQGVEQKKSFLRQSKGRSIDSPEQTERAVLKGADSGTIAGRDFVKAPWNTAERLCRTRICRERPLLNRRMR